MINDFGGIMIEYIVHLSLVPNIGEQSKEGNLELKKTSNADNPIREGYTPLLVADVWEHAYYLDYQNRRPDHLASLWNIINWEIISERYKQ